MNSQPIYTESLGKRYRIGERRPYSTLRDSLTNAFKKPFKKSIDLISSNSSVRQSQSGETHIWAIKDISIQVDQGDVVGVIGSNGSGKTTLLRTLSSITKPTEGFAEIKGRVGSLLEVGTGFHPELTGRENVFLNGAILGMRRSEITDRFDEIVDFSGVSKFIDTPVKLYSSGMYLRLAFAVAAHLESEILLVDEVLAVGDADFQQKCLGKMQDLAATGRTVLFVSHNMTAVANLCNKAVYLKEGRVMRSGATDSIVESYLGAITESATTNISQIQNRTGTGDIRFSHFSMLNDQGEEITVVKSGDNLTFHMGFEYPSTFDVNEEIYCRIRVKNAFGQTVTIFSSYQAGGTLSHKSSSRQWRCTIPKTPLMPGRYNLDLYCGVRGQTFDDIRDVQVLEIVGGDFFESGRIASKSKDGFVLIDQNWETL